MVFETVARLRSREAFLHEQVKSKIPKRLKKLKARRQKLEDKRISAVKRRQMKVAFACVEKVKKATNDIEDTETILKNTQQKLEKINVETKHHLLINQELATNFDRVEEGVPAHGTLKTFRVENLFKLF